MPRALAEVDGTPHKGNKSNWTDKLKGRYTSAPPFKSSLEWLPEVVIIDAMFILNTTPLRQHETLDKYAVFLFKQFAMPHFSRGTKEVHFVFDYPSRCEFNPKECEHKRRYKETGNGKHSHIEFEPESQIPKPWCTYLNCRQCKRSIVEAIGLAYLRKGNSYVGTGHLFYLAGYFTGINQDMTWKISNDNRVPSATTRFQSNALEADMRVWRHATQVHYNQILVYSPDTDVYNIGLTMLQHIMHGSLCGTDKFTTVFTQVC